MNPHSSDSSASPATGSRAFYAYALNKINVFLSLLFKIKNELKRKYFVKNYDIYVLCNCVLPNPVNL